MTTAQRAAALANRTPIDFGGDFWILTQPWDLNPGDRYSEHPEDFIEYQILDIDENGVVTGAPVIFGQLDRAREYTVTEPVWVREVLSA